MASFTPATPFILPTHLRRNASWPPMSTRHLPSLAPVHFHLAASSIAGKRQQSSSRHSPSSGSSVTSSRTTTVSSSSSSSSSSSRHRARAQREHELPDIDEDPFAHFLSPMTEEEMGSPFADGDDALAFSAGIVVSDDEGVGDAADGDSEEPVEGAVGLWGDGVMRDRLRSRLARRWAKYVGRWYDGGGEAGGGEGGGDETAAGGKMQRAAAALGDERCVGAGTRSRRRRPESGSSPPQLDQIDEDRDAEMEEEARAMEREMERNMAVDEGYISEEVVSTIPSGGGGLVAMDKRKTSQQRPKRPGPEPLMMSPYRTVVREPTKGRAQDLVDGRMSKRRKYRHSWRAPDRDLFTVVEEQGEGGDASEIGQRYFSAF